jgi:hypothetical protein
MFFSYSIESGIPVLHLFGSIPNTFVHSLYGYDSTYRYEEYQLKAYPRADYDGFGLVVLSDIKELDADLSSKLVQFINNGGTVWFFPDMDGQLVNYNQFLARLSLPEITSVNNYPIQTRMGESLSKWMEKVIINPAKNPRLPAVNQSFRMTGSRADYSPLLSGMAGEMILSQFSIGKGRFILSTFPLKEEATDLMFHPLFVPLCYKLASAGIKDAPLYQVIGKENALEVPTSLISGTGNIRLVNTGTNEQYSPVFRAGAGGSSFIFADGIESTGYFNLFQGENLKGTFAFNSSRRESDLRILADSLVIEKLTNAGWRTSKNLLSHQDLNKNTNNELPINKQLWHYLLIISIIILLFESWLMHNKK